MDFEQFKEMIVEDLQAYLSGVNIETHAVSKLQGQSYEGLVVRPEGSPVGATLNLDQAFAEYENTGSYERTLIGLEDSVKAALQDIPAVEANSFVRYENVKDSLTVQLIPTKMNEEMLQTIPHKEMEDMSIVYRILVDSNQNGNATVLITNDILKNYGISAEQLHQDAMESAQRIAPAQIKNMSEVLAEMSGMDPEMFGGMQSPMYVASTPNMTNGAGVISYPDFMEQAREKLGADFYVLPSSVHEVILLRDDGTMSDRELSQMVRDVNANEVAPEDRLSDQAFHYDSEEKVFETAQNYESRKAEQEYSEEHAQDSENREAAEIHEAEVEMTVLSVCPGKYPEMVKVGTELEDLQMEVGGMIEVVYPFDEEVGIICNEEGKINGMPLNRALRDDQGEVQDILAGNFLVVGLTDEGFRSLTPEEGAKFEARFHQPETFIKMGKSIQAIPIPDDMVRKLAEQEGRPKLREDRTREPARGAR